MMLPGLSTSASLVVTAYTAIQNVKLYRERCEDLASRCKNMLVAIEDSSRGLEGTRIVEVSDELTVVIQRVSRQMKEWGSWNRLRCLVQQGEMKDGLERLNRELDICMMKFNIQSSMEINRGHIDIRTVQDRDNLEIREALRAVVKNQDDLKELLTARPARDVEGVMESLQTQLMLPSLPPREKEDFKAGLWQLHEQTARLPPLTDLTGQISLTSPRPIMTGSSNDIFQGQWLDKQMVALRSPRALDDSLAAKRGFEREVAFWRELDHPNVVPLYGIVNINGKLCSVTPWMDNGTAPIYIKNFPDSDRLKLLYEVASGLEYLHKKKIVHGDLRGQNVLVSKDGVACLSDFGLSKFFEDCDKRLIPSNNASIRWTAPEVRRNGGLVSMHSDVWSFGMVCLEILSGQIPFHNKDDGKVERQVDDGKHPACPVSVSPEMWDVMLKCWAKNPEHRLPMSSVKALLQDVRARVNHLPATPLDSSYRPGSEDSADATYLPSPSRTAMRSRRPMLNLTTFFGRKNSINENIHSRPFIRDPSPPPRLPGSPPQQPERTFFNNNPGDLIVATQSPTSYRSNTISSVPESSPDHSNTPLTGTSTPWCTSKSREGMSPTSRPNVRRPATVDSSIMGHRTSTTHLGYRGGSLILSHQTSSRAGTSGPPKSPVLASPSSSSTSSNFSSGEQPRLPELQFLTPTRSQETVLSPPGPAHLHRFSSASSTKSSDSGHQRSLALQNAAQNAHCILNASAGLVTSGTLQGLVQFLIDSFNSPRHAEYREIFLMGCCEFTTPGEVFQILKHRFLEEENERNAEKRVNTQYNIFMILSFWLERGFFSPSQELLYRMKFFCQKAVELKSPGTLGEKARVLHDVVESKIERQSTLQLDPGGPILQSSQVTPRHLAIGLALLEGDHYKDLHASDYIMYLIRHRSSKVKSVFDTNNKIKIWVTESILHYEDVHHRVEVLKFFIHSAVECQELRNFSSAIAIASALHSPAVENLKVTRKSLTRTMQGKLADIYNIVNPESNYRGYREALATAATIQKRETCIPWLSLHLEELERVLSDYAATIEEGGQDLINFSRYTRFMDRVKEVMYYIPPDLEGQRHQGQLAYLLNQIRSIRVSSETDERLMTRSKTLMTQEATDYLSRKPQLEQLGFKVE